SLLPVGCVRSVPYSAQYEEAYKCNFLGLSTDVPIPAHVSSSEFSVLVDVTLKLRQGLAAGEDELCALYQFTISSANTQPTDREAFIFHFATVGRQERGQRDGKTFGKGHQIQNSNPVQPH
ncbi:hypothetical protein ILYODFUR_016742, partial [Ilyodon furcidens]